MKARSSHVIVAAAALSLITVTLARAQDCTDRVTGGGYIFEDGRPTGFANFGAGGGRLHGDLTGYLNYVDHNPASPVRHVRAQDVVAYCIGCNDRDCRRITYSPATVDGVEVNEVIVEVCDNGEPGVEDSFRICIPSLGYCRGGVLGGDDKPSGGTIQLHAGDPGCGGTIPVCTALTQCPCFPPCP